jgi:hypothetical protein
VLGLAWVGSGSVGAVLVGDPGSCSNSLVVVSEESGATLEMCD